MKEQEFWYRCPYPYVRYMVNVKGEVRHFRNNTIRHPARKGRSYAIVTIPVKGTQCRIYVAKLVWESIYGKIPAGMTINHINGNKIDNRIENLELVTQQQNNLHSILLYSRPVRYKGIAYLNREEARRLTGVSRYQVYKNCVYISHLEMYLSAMVTCFHDISDMYREPFLKYYKFMLDNHLFKHEHE